MQKPIRGDHRVEGRLGSVIFSRQFEQIMLLDDLVEAVTMTQAACEHNGHVRGWAVGGEVHARCTLCGHSCFPVSAWARDPGGADG